MIDNFQENKMDIEHYENVSTDTLNYTYNYSKKIPKPVIIRKNPVFLVVAKYLLYLAIILTLGYFGSFLLDLAMS